MQVASIIHSSLRADAPEPGNMLTGGGLLTVNGACQFR